MNRYRYPYNLVLIANVLIFFFFFEENRFSIFQVLVTANMIMIFVNDIQIFEFNRQEVV